MITPRLRPRLEMTARRTPADLAARVQQRLGHPDSPCRGLATEDQIELRIREADRHFWSPQLVVIVKPDPDEDGATHLTGHFGPNANVWTMFLAAYGFIVLSTITGVFYGLAQLVLGEPAWALWSVPVGAVLVAFIYLAAGIGQRLGHDQVDVLLNTLEAAVGDESNHEVVEAPFEHDRDGA